MWKNANKSTSMYYQIPPSYEPLKPFPWSLETCFKSELKYYGVKLNFKLASFSKDNARILNTEYLTTNTSSQIYLQKALIHFTPTSRTSRKPLVEKAPVNYIGWRQVVGKIGNGVVSLLLLLRCHCNPVDHNKFSSLSNTILVVICPNLCQLRRSCWNMGGIDAEKPRRATLQKCTVSSSSPLLYFPCM